MPAPKISVVTVSLNQAAYLEANIGSILAQGYPSVEHIIVDGGSTDGTIDLLNRNPHLRWVSERDSGQSNALNKGIAMATGDVVGWLNSDDTYEPEAFDLVAKEFADPGAMVVFGDGHEIDAAGKVTKTYRSQDVSFDGLVRYWRWRYEFVQPAFFFRRTVFAEVGGLDEGLHYAMDFDLFIRLAARYEFRYVPKPLANLRLHSESKTGREYRRAVPEYIREMQKVSFRNWGSPAGPGRVSYALSFAGALLWSLLKNLFFLPGSKSRQRLGGPAA